MLTEICAEIRNYFVEPGGIHEGNFTISGGNLTPLNYLKNGQYFRIVGSTFNDGVHRYPATDLTDESFAGSVWAMKVPPAFIALTEEIQNWCASDAAKPSAFISESFGGYSYTKATDPQGVVVSWRSAFASRLNPYRRLSVL